MNINRFLINLSRFLIAALIVFELLNQFKILRFPLTFTWLGLILTGAGAWFLIELISLFNKKAVGRPVYGLAMLVATAGLYLDAGGDVFLLFVKYGWYDQVAHFIGGAAAAGIIYSLTKGLDDCGRIKVGDFGEAFFAWTTANFLGAVYEIAEYAEDFFTGSHRLGDAFDTANDMLLNLTGSFSILAVFLFYFYVRRRSHSVN